MDRKDFLRILGVATLSPSVMIVSGTGTVKKEIPVSKFKPKRFPIYPDRTQFSFQEGNYICHTSFTYVKINQNNTDYLIPVKETTVDSKETNDKRFEYSVQEVKDNFIVDESNIYWFDSGFVIKYNPEIHHD